MVQQCYKRRMLSEAWNFCGSEDQGTQYFTVQEAPATPAEHQATVYRYSNVRAADEIRHEDP